MRKFLPKARVLVDHLEELDYSQIKYITRKWFDNREAGVVGNIVAYYARKDGNGMGFHTVNTYLVRYNDKDGWNKKGYFLESELILQETLPFDQEVFPEALKDWLNSVD